jgi:hypothetical protein
MAVGDRAGCSSVSGLARLSVREVVRQQLAGDADHVEHPSDTKRDGTELEIDA